MCFFLIRHRTLTREYIHPKRTSLYITIFCGIIIYMYRRQLRRAFPLPWSEPDEDDEGGGMPGWGWALIAFIVVVLIITLAVLPLGFPCKTYDIYGWCPCNPPENKKYDADKKICSCETGYTSEDPAKKPCTKLECTGGKEVRGNVCTCPSGYVDKGLVCEKVESPGTSSNEPTKKIEPRQTSTLTDCGYMSKTHGWYDMQNQGVKNDYCRYVGDDANISFSCALAGSTNQYTPRSVEYNPLLSHEIGGTGPCVN